MNTWKLVGCAVALTFAATAATTAWADSVEENNPYAALQWTFGDKSLKPDVVLGYRSVDVETNGDVSGWQASASYAPHEGIDKLKVEGVTGDEDVQYTYGAGYSLQERKALLTAGVNGNHLVAGGDVLLGKRKKLEAYFGVTTQGDYDVPEESTTSKTTTTSTSQSTATNVNNSQTAVNNNLQTEHFPEYTDCGC